ncbi:MAG: PAC2 family protein [Solirubrobacterales bacterium]|nr:PAC2 family protein [Solirubrobacterales bacterium]
MREGAAESIVWSDADTPRGPILVVSFQGWNDAGNAASAAVSYLGQTGERRKIAEIDPEHFFDFQSHRPQISVIDGDVRFVEWPRNVFYQAEVGGLEGGVLLLEGEEPSMHWQTFCDAIITVAQECEVTTVVMLGSLLADVPHTRSSAINAISPEEEMTHGLGFRTANYEGPTGITGVLQHHCAKAGLKTVSLWASVPHYVAATPNPPAALALVRAFEGITGALVDAAELESAADRFKEQVSAAVAQDDEISGYVKTLEENADADADDESTNPIPSGDAIAKEIQRYLRTQEGSS